MLTIDGAQGEGGGQILRTSLALALVTGQALRMRRIRAGRAKPGLRRQHLVAVEAAAQVGQAQVTGAKVGSLEITLVPGAVRSGDFVFRIGSAGSTTLVLQTVLPALLRAAGRSQITLEGGTHNPFAPPFDFVRQVFLPLLNRMGPRVAASLTRPGFYPAGGGEISVSVTPAARLEPLELLERGRVQKVVATAWISRLPRQIAERELETVQRELSRAVDEVRINEVAQPRGPGNVVSIQIDAEGITELFTGFGQRGVPAERVAKEVAAAAQRYLDADVPVGEHLADQLLLPLALAGGGTFRTQEFSRHAETNRHVITQFLDCQIEVVPEPRGTVLVRVAST